MKRTLLLSCLMALTLSIWAQGPNGTGTYYQAADGKKGAELKSVLCDILADGYEGEDVYVYNYNSSMWAAYETTDVHEVNGIIEIWDMYSATSHYSPSNHGNYSKENDAYNREHSVPQSWFNKESPMVSDLFHVYPTDGFVNGKRSNYPYGETDANKADWNQSYISNEGFSKLGKCKTEGYSGIVFEPNDLYKGDFARTYFYMLTRYEGVDFTSAEGANVFEKGTYPGMKTWALNMFIRWAANDEISDKEYNRNNAVCELQSVRNPFIDYPGLEQYIWGSMKDVAFSYDNYQVPENYSPYVPGDDPGPGPGPGPVDPPTPAEGEYLYLRIASASDLEEGAGYIIVCESEKVAMAEQGNNIRNYVSLTTTDGMVTTEVNKSGKPYELTLGTHDGKYTLYDATGKVYLSQTAKNNINTATSPSDNGALWTISFSGYNAVITSSYSTGFTIQYNKSAPRFACYSSSQTPVQLYKRQPKPDDGTTIAAFPISQAKKNTIVYDLQGRPVGTTADAHLHLKKGIYIIGNRKVVIK